MSFDTSSLFCGLFFGVIGYAAWRYGRRMTSVRHLLLGLVLMVYGYFIPNVWLNVSVGAVLTLLLFWP